ncbi:MAG: glycerophosphodiester phosphodiesterase family protein [bacterium]|nr:glycerophosphodiester phosphodiesterase family protein [bacterium]
MSRRFPGLTVALCALAAFSCSPKADRPIGVVAHRGANALAPENTMAAAQAAVDAGADYVELDIRTSKDGVMYNLHDESVERTTDGEGMLFTLTSEQIDQLDAGSWFDPKFADARVPRVDEMLKWAKGKTGVYLDVKAADLEALIALVHELDLEEDCFFWFEIDSVAERFRQLAPDLSLKVNASTPKAVENAIKELAPQIVETTISQLTPDFVKLCRENGIRIMIREETGDPAAFQAILGSEADMVNLDHPGVFATVRDGSR